MYPFSGRDQQQRQRDFFEEQFGNSARLGDRGQWRRFGFPRETPDRLVRGSTDRLLSGSPVIRIRITFQTPG